MIFLNYYVNHLITTFCIVEVDAYFTNVCDDGKKRMKNGRFSTIAGISVLLGVLTLPAHALQSPHPEELYSQGMRALNSYHGQPDELIQAQNHFIRLLEKYPDSPLGYLGMSRIYTIDAYRYDHVYDMEKIRDLALPFAIKALELGPSVRAVHEHYSHFEEIFQEFSLYKKRVQDDLNANPGAPETYYAVATFIRDQNEYTKALDYYKAALDMEPGEDLKLRILKRIGYIYLNDTGQPEKAVEYYNQALKLRESSPLIHEYLGLAYLKMQDYSDAISMLTRAVNIMPGIIPQFHLLEAQGYQAEQEGKIEEAIQSLEQACQIKPAATSTAHYRLGNLYYNRQNFSDAFSHFRRVIDLDPQLAQAYFLAAKSAQSLGKERQAVTYYKKYLQMDAHSKEADWIRANVPALTHSK